jgi:hypothetical protein
MSNRSDRCRISSFEKRPNSWLRVSETSRGLEIVSLWLKAGIAKNNARAI